MKKLKVTKKQRKAIRRNFAYHFSMKHGWVIHLSDRSYRAGVVNGVKLPWVRIKRVS